VSKHLLLLALSGPLLCCGKRGDPRPPLPRTPQAVGEFKVAQRGDRIELGLVAPRTTTGGERLPVLEPLATGQRAACFYPVAADEWQRTRLGGEAA